MISDEAFYVTAANSLLHGTAANFEHPPLVKLIIAGSIAIAGNTWIAWRLPIIVFAVVATFFTYKIGKTFLTERQSIYATALLCTSTIFFLVGSIGMLDIPMIAFSLAGIYFIIKGRYVYASILFGIAFLCKEVAIVFAGAALIYLIIKKVSIRKIYPSILVFVGIILVGLGIYDYFYRQTVYGLTITNPIQQAAAIILYQFRLNSARILSPYPPYPPIGWVHTLRSKRLKPATLCDRILRTTPNRTMVNDTKPIHRIRNVPVACGSATFISQNQKQHGTTINVNFSLRILTLACSRILL